jgi:protein-disulfide isomerase
MRRIFKGSRIVRRASPATVALVAIVAMCVIALGYYEYNQIKVARQHTATDKDWSLIVPSITAADHTIGDLHAPIQVIVYSDFECKYCEALFRGDIPKLQQAFPHQLVIAYRHRVLDSDPASDVEEEASECVAQSGGNEAFWKFAYSMFAQPKSVDKKNTDTLESLALQAGAHKEQYESCMRLGAMKAEVNAQTLQASIAGISLDPSAVLKSAHRAIVVQGEHYSQLETGIQYLLDTNAQMQSR